MQNARKTEENRVRGRAGRAGYILRKSRQSTNVPNINNFGEYMLVDAFMNFVVLGEKFDASLDEIEAFLT